MSILSFTFATEEDLRNDGKCVSVSQKTHKRNHLSLDEIWATWMCPVWDGFVCAGTNSPSQSPYGKLYHDPLNLCDVILLLS